MRPATISPMHPSRAAVAGSFLCVSRRRETNPKEINTGNNDDGTLYMLGLLHVSGTFKLWF